MRERSCGVVPFASRLGPVSSRKALCSIIVSVVALLLPQWALAASAGLRDTCRSSKPPCGWLWGPANENVPYLSVSRTHEVDAGGEHLYGITLASGELDYFSEAHPYLPFGIALELSLEQGKRLSIFGTDLKFAGPVLSAGPVRIGPRAGIGVEYRTHDPDPGAAGLFTIGGELGVWVGRRVELVSFVDREFDLPGRTTNRVGVELRVRTIGSFGNFFD